MPDRLNVRNFIHGGDYNPDQWTDHPEIIAKDFEMFKEAKINSVTVGIFAWDKLEPSEGTYDFSWLDDIFDRAEKQGCHVILSTPSGARPRWMAEKYPEEIRNYIPVVVKLLNEMKGTKTNALGVQGTLAGKIERSKEQTAKLSIARISNRYGLLCILCLLNISNFKLSTSSLP